MHCTTQIKDSAFPLAVAATIGHVEMVEMLLKNDSSPELLNAKARKTKAPPLKHAVDFKYLPVVKLLSVLKLSNVF